MNNSEIAHRRLQNQGLSRIIFKNVNDAVTHLGAVQAQDYAGAKWALGQRLKDSTDSDLDQAFADGSILRTHLLRPTWHFVTPEDIRWLLKLTAPRVHAISGFMYRQVELDKVTVGNCYKILEKALEGNKHLTRTELGSIIDKAGIPAKGVRLAYIMMSAELDGLVCSGPRKGKQFTYALLEERVPQVRVVKREEALAELVRRYFSTRGPATLKDFTVWSGLTMADAKSGVEMVKSDFINEELDGKMYWFPELKSSLKQKSLTAHLLPNYDEYFIGFKDRSAIGEVAKKAGIKSNDPRLISHIVILDGQVVGGWRRTLNKDSVTVEVNLITKLTKADERVVQDAAGRFGKFLKLPVDFILQERFNEKRKTRSF
jgi:hypothetical protein